MSGGWPVGIFGRQGRTILRQVIPSAPLFSSISPRMKTSSIVLACLTLTLVGLKAQNASPATAGQSTGNAPALPPPTAYHVVERGANHKTWQRETFEPGPQGQVVTHLHKFKELANGMHFKDAQGKWEESQEQITAFAGGAIAQQSQYQVIFANNLNSAGAIDQQTPDLKRLRSNILGLAYRDRATGRTVVIAQIQDSPGELISANQVIYLNAFQGIKGDVRYT